MFSLFLVVNQGRTEDPAQQEIELTTAPSTNNGTHWGQQVCATKNKTKKSYTCKF